MVAGRAAHLATVRKHKREGKVRGTWGSGVPGGAEIDHVS